MMLDAGIPGVVAMFWVVAESCIVVGKTFCNINIFTHCCTMSVTTSVAKFMHL